MAQSLLESLQDPNSNRKQRRADLLLIRRALKNGWPITADMKKAVVGVAMRILELEQEREVPDSKEVFRAASILLAASKENQADRHLLAKLMAESEGIDTGDIVAKRVIIRVEPGVEPPRRVESHEVVAEQLASEGPTPENLDVRGAPIVRDIRDGTGE